MAQTTTRRRRGAEHLPERMGPLLSHALEDLAWCRAHGYEVSLQGWHEGAHRDEEGQLRCSVDLAGAVMARSLGVGRSETRTPADYPEPLRGRLVALDMLSRGEVEDGIRRATGRKAKLGDRRVPCVVHGPGGVDGGHGAACRGSGNQR